MICMAPPPGELSAEWPAEGGEEEQAARAWRTNAREEQAPPLRRDRESKMGFSLGRSCLRSRLMRGKYCHLIHRKRSPFPSRGRLWGAVCVSGRLEANMITSAAREEQAPPLRGAEGDFDLLRHGNVRSAGDGLISRHFSLGLV